MTVARAFGLVWLAFFDTHELAIGYSFVVVLLGVLGALSAFIGTVLSVIQKIRRQSMIWKDAGARYPYDLTLDELGATHFKTN